METPEFAACPRESRRSVATANREGGDALFLRVDRLEMLADVGGLVKRLRARARANRRRAGLMVQRGQLGAAKDLLERAERYEACVVALECAQ